MMMSGAFSGLTVLRSSRMFPNTCTCTLAGALPHAVTLFWIDGCCGLSTQMTRLDAPVLCGAAVTGDTTRRATAPTASMNAAARAMRLLNMCVLPYSRMAIRWSVPLAQPGPLSGTRQGAYFTTRKQSIENTYDYEPRTEDPAES